MSAASTAADFTGDLLSRFATVDRTVQPSGSQSQEVVLVLGNTGAGKSTFVNYIVGRRMREAEVPSSLQQGFLCDDAVVEIGHGFESRTDFPHSVIDRDIAYCDCPGFSDTRGPMFDITNTYAIGKVARSARSVKGVVYVMSYHALLADRAAALEEMVFMLQKLFGSRDLRSRAESVMLLVSKAPPDVTLSELRDYVLAKLSWNNPVCHILSQMQMYDPLDRYQYCAAGRLRRIDVVAKIRGFACFSGDDVTYTMSPAVAEAVVRALTAAQNAAFAFQPVSAAMISSPDVSTTVNRLMEALLKLSVFNISAIQQVHTAVQRSMRHCLAKIFNDKEATPSKQALKQLKQLRDTYPLFVRCVDIYICVVEETLRVEDEARTLKEKMAAEERSLEKKAHEEEQRLVAALRERQLQEQRNREAEEARQRAAAVARERQRELDDAERRQREAEQRQYRHNRQQQQEQAAIQQAMILNFLMFGGGQVHYYY